MQRLVLNIMEQVNMLYVLHVISYLRATVILLIWVKKNGRQGRRVARYAIICSLHHYVACIIM